MSDHDLAVAHVVNSGSGIADDSADCQCRTCGWMKDHDGFCRCDLPAMVCAWCDTVMRLGPGLDTWEAGLNNPDAPISHGLCGECAVRFEANERSV